MVGIDGPFPTCLRVPPIIVGSPFIVDRGALLDTSLVIITLLSLRVAALATLAMIVPAVALGYVLARWRFPGKALLEAVLLLPMILPPVAVGLALLALLARDGPIGALVYEATGETLLLSWWAAVIAAWTVSLPLFVKAAQQSFAAVPRRLEQVALTMGKSPGRIFFKVSLPLAWRGIVHGTLLAFARALGEFGATSLVAGLIPGRTETLALGIYARIVNGRESEAWVLAGISAALALVALLASNVAAQRHERHLHGGHA